jgi:hypothetical protein
MPAQPYAESLPQKLQWRWWLPNANRCGIPPLGLSRRQHLRESLFGLDRLVLKIKKSAKRFKQLGDLNSKGSKLKKQTVAAERLVTAPLQGIN